MKCHVCERKAKARGFCASHYKSMMDDGTIAQFRRRDEAKLAGLRERLKQVGPGQLADEIIRGER